MSVNENQNTNEDIVAILAQIDETLKQLVNKLNSVSAITDNLKKDT